MPIVASMQSSPFRAARVSIIVAALTILGWSHVVHAGSNSNDYAEVLRHYATAKNFNGTVLVASGGKIEYLAAQGISNRQSNTTLTTKSKFKIASVTKTFTTVMVLQLLQEGKLDLKATIGNYLPSYKGEARDKVTLDHLLTYSAGIPNCEGSTGLGVYQRKATVDEFIAANASGKLEFVPGAKFSYDNGAYIILGRMIELVTGKSFAQNLQERILRPLGMNDTAMLANEDVVTGLATTYNIDDKSGKFLVDDPMYIENYFAAGAMYSTAEDLFRFDQGLFAGNLLKPATRKLMLTPRPTLYNVALGFWVTDNKYGNKSFKQAMRQGSIWGANADWVHLIDAKKSIIILSNTNATDLPDFASQLIRVATGQTSTVPRAAAAPTVATNASALVGTWQLDLRPDPSSAPYLKDFIVAPTTSKEFAGEFYGTKFDGGRMNTDWERIYFAFSTHDQSNTYFHSGSVDGDNISGISYSPERKFTSHWTGVRKKP
jgi:teichoic acid D-alanine hydrolase